MVTLWYLCTNIKWGKNPNGSYILVHCHRPVVAMEINLLYHSKSLYFSFSLTGQRILQKRCQQIITASVLLCHTNGYVHACKQDYQCMFLPFKLILPWTDSSFKSQTTSYDNFRLRSPSQYWHLVSHKEAQVAML